MPETVVPVFFFLIVVGGPIAAWIVSRVLAHNERMEMIRHGYAPPPQFDPKAMKRAMKYGAWAPGQPMPPGFQAPMYDTNYYAQHQLRRGIQVSFIGLALLIGLGFIGYHGAGMFEPGPWLLGGLIPMFVGIAQIISAVLSGAQLGRPGVAAGTQQAQWGPPPEAEVPPAATAAGPSGPPPPPSSYGGWRPGGMPEIGKPAPPPDRL